MTADFLPELEDRFLRYVRVDTPSDEKSGTLPSTACQWDLLRMLQAELADMGAADVTLTDTGFVMATIPASPGAESAPTVAFLAHADTSPAFAAEGVNPIVHRNYDGSVIRYSDNPKLTLDPAEFPYLAQKTGDDIITAGGTTLLGADDKAGIAVIMTMASYLLHHPDTPHGRIRICFTPDEEIGSGIRHIDLDLLGADFAYTLDGADLGDITYESFSADKAVITIQGVSAHPGTAFGVMVNALHLAANLLSALPMYTRTPETTQGKQGFVHVYEMRGSAASAELSLILRDFELEGLQAHGDFLRALCDAIQQSEPRAQISLSITPQYRNMRYWLENDMRPVDIAVEAIRSAGITPVFKSIRGGTDGSQLTEMGLPTPNLFTGMQNVHGPQEWISLQDMAQSTAVCIRLAELITEQQSER
ncbi:MAG: peptidase T [Chloroflexota bacterium]|nr:peptidase T [Chloroflexota bacterium]